MNELLTIDNLKTYFYTSEGTIQAVNGVSLSIQEGETLGVVGESGCGKSVTALSILKLIPDPPGKIVEGSVHFQGTDLLALDKRAMRDIRGKKISMIFQEPMTSLDPVFTVGHEIVETITTHQDVSKQEAKKRAIEILGQVGISDPERRFDCYPHELSGGIRQRVMIAMALSCNPALLIADEPTTALDVTIQAQILRLINEMKTKTGASVMLITHDLGVIAEMCDNVAVMYSGYIVEYSDVFTLFEKPLHPYTNGLKKSIPRLDEPTDELDAIKGIVPNLARLPRGCPFHPRCDKAFDLCREKMPELIKLNDNHSVRCHLFGEK